MAEMEKSEILKEVESDEEVELEVQSTPKKTIREGIENLIGWAVTVAIAFVVGCIITTNIFFRSDVHGISMYPTYKEGDTVFALVHSKITRGDVVIVETEGKYLIKRVIGLPRDIIEIKEGTVYINGYEYDESSYVVNKDRRNVEEVVVGENELYVLGDNRTNSHDSRDIGCVSFSKIKGVVIKANKRGKYPDTMRNFILSGGQDSGSEGLPRWE